MDKIQPIETYYKGYRFRSRLEARWAVFFDNLGVEWEYEPEGFKLPSGKLYLPDFRLKCYGCRGSVEETPFDLYVEVKGVMTQEDADKINEFCGYSEYEVIGFDGKHLDHPVLILGNIPDVTDTLDITDSSICKSYDRMNGVDIYSFNYQTIDFDHFAAYPAATADGKFYLFGDDCNYINNEDCNRVLNAYLCAKQARFEHGEHGCTNARV